MLALLWLELQMLEYRSLKRWYFGKYGLISWTLFVAFESKKHKSLSQTVNSSFQGRIQGGRGGGGGGVVMNRVAPFFFYLSANYYIFILAETNAVYLT